MPVYEFHCPDCARYQEELQGAHDEHVCHCPQCGRKMDRIFSPPYLTGDLPASKTTVMGYDDTFGCEVRGKAHQKQLMEQRGLVPYEPNPEMEGYRKELRYIKKHGPGDAGRAAAKKVHQEMGQKRRGQAVNSVWERAAIFKE